jgi:tetratricopeptide (TPR) repeat protein
MVAGGYMTISDLRERPARQHLAAGMDYAERGLGAAAEREWQAALRISPQFLDAHRMLGEYYMTTHQWHKAIAQWEQLRQLAPREPHVQCKMAEALMRSGQEVDALRWAERELKRDRQCLKALLTAGILTDKTSDRRRAAEYLRAAATLRPTDPQVLIVLGRSLTKSGQYQEARVVLRRVLQLSPRSAEAHYLLGWGAARSPSEPDHIQRAEQYYREVLRLNPLHAGARLELGRLALQRHDPPAAVFQLEEAARLMPQNAQVFFTLAQAYESARDAAKARKARAKFLRLSQRDATEAALLKRCAADANDAESHYRLGALKWEKGEAELARYFLRQAARVKPHDARIQAALRKLEQPLSPPDPPSRERERAEPHASASASPALKRKDTAPSP